MRREMFTKKDGTPVANIVANVIDYKKESGWYYSHGFRYNSKAYNAAVSGVAKASWSVNEKTFSEKYPKEYAAICKRDGIKPMTHTEEPKAQPEYSLEELLAMRATLNKAIAQKRKAAK